MKNTKRKIFLYILMALSIILFGILGLNLLQKNGNAYASTSDINETGETDNSFVVLSNANNIPATYEYVALNDTECAVRITNKSTATKAVIPSFVEMDGKTYSVTEVVSNGFISASQLERVSLPNSIKKLGNFAFANCKKLERINLANVEEIGNNAFYRCPELKELILPKSVNKIGSNILSGNNTQVKVRAEAVGADWHTSWNTNNQNQVIEFNSKTVQPLELEPVYESSTRSSENSIIGYALAGGQPRTDDFYITKENADSSTDTDSSNNIFIPKEYNGEEIVGIASNAFEGSSFNQLVVEYSDNSLKLGNNAFLFATGSNITFNRSVEFYDRDTKAESNNVFTLSSIEAIVLPTTITKFANQMFSNCFNLKNIFFTEPKDNLTRKELLNIVETEAKEADEGVVYLPADSELSYIGDAAFMGDVSISELHIYDSIEYIGQFALADWDDGEQTVFIHNTKKIRGWHEKWNSTFTNIKYDITFYTLSFNTDGGTVDQLYKDVEADKAIGEMPIPVKPGLVFLGWYLNNEKYDSSTLYTLKSDVELIAHWGYTVTFGKMGGTGGSDYVYAELNKPMPDAVKPERFGYEFKGYYTSPEGQGIRYYDDYMSGCRTWDNEQSITLYALWQQKKIVVEFEKEGGENGSNFVIANFDEDMPEATAPQINNYRFMGYFTEQNGNGDMYYNSQMQSVRKCDKIEKLSLYAYWERLYTITLNKNDGTGGTDSVEVIYGEEMPAAVAPSLEHYTFLGYYFNEDNTPYYNANMSSNRKMDKQQDITLIAKYTPTAYRIYYQLNDNTRYPAKNLMSDVTTITYFNTVLLGEPLREGFGFDGWYLDGVKVSELKNIDRNITLSARWTADIYNVLPNSPSYNYNSPYVILELNTIILGFPYSINIGPKVKSLYIYANSGRAADITMNIVVLDKSGSGLMTQKRTDNLKLILKNINIKATSGHHAIVMDSEYALMLYSYNSSITGAETLSPKNDTLTTKQGSSAIYCKTLSIFTSVTLKGGSNAYMSSTNFVGGVAVSLINGGKIYLQSDGIKIIGGDCNGLMGYAGCAVYSKGKYEIVHREYYSVQIEYGIGSKPNLLTNPPYVGY